MGDFKILILAYLIGHSPIETQQTFQMEGWYKSMEECKKELLLQKPDGRYEVMNEFVVDGEFKWDWLVAGWWRGIGNNGFYYFYFTYYCPYGCNFFSCW